MSIYRTIGPVVLICMILIVIDMIIICMDYKIKVLLVTCVSTITGFGQALYILFSSLLGVEDSEFGLCSRWEMCSQMSTVSEH